MIEKLIFKIFGFSEQVVRKKLSEISVTPMLVEENHHDVKIVVTVEGEKKSETSDAIYRRFPKAIYADADVTLAEAIVERLRLYGKRVAVAESLTGGLVTSALVSVPGCSECLIEGIVAYSEDAKLHRLSVPINKAEGESAVSARTAQLMAYGLVRIGADFAVSTTGYAGPGGGTESDPVGTVYIGTAGGGEIGVSRWKFEGTREDVRLYATNTALFMLWKKILKPIDFDNKVIE